MALKQQLHQKQVQKLILAPALQQAIKLLPLTNLELIEIIDAELSQNPILEIEKETAEKKTKEKPKERSAGKKRAAEREAITTKRKAAATEERVSVTPAAQQISKTDKMLDRLNRIHRRAG